MGHAQETTSATKTASVEQYDAIVIGAGVSGLYHLCEEVAANGDEGFQLNE